ncbi:MAG: pitrilysin family protein [Patescibacteria group bacterium]|nr:pitrilysin family protein [Patescibacteria group bacterium]
MYKKIQIPNGPLLITAPREGTSAITLLVLIPVGSRYEQKNINGSSHFVEHLMFKGTQKRPTSLDLTKELDAVGAEYNAFTSKDHTGYYIKAASNHLELAFDILSDMVRNSKFDPAEVQKERGVIIEEINMYEDNPLMHVENLFEEAVFGLEHPMGWNIAGPREVIREVPRDRLYEYFQTYYHPRRMVVAVAGKFKQTQVQELMKRHFTVDSPKPQVGKFPPFTAKQTKPHLKVWFKETEQVQLCLGYPAYAYGHKNLPALTLLSIILGGNMSSRLFTSVREKHGLAYFIKASTSPYQDTGTFVVQAGLDKARLDQAIKLIIEELRMVVAAGVTEKELTGAKDFLEGKIVLEFEDSAQLAEWYGKQQVLTGKMETPQQRLALLKKVTVPQVQKVAADVFNPSRMNLALIGPYKDETPFLKLLQ